MKIFRKYIWVNSPQITAVSSQLSKEEENVDYQVIEQMERAATLLPRGIFRARPAGSCCISSSLDLTLGSDGPAFLLPLPDDPQLFETRRKLVGTSLQDKVCESSRQPSHRFLIFEYKHQVLPSTLNTDPRPDLIP